MFQLDVRPACPRILLVHIPCAFVFDYGGSDVGESKGIGYNFRFCERCV